MRDDKLLRGIFPHFTSNYEAPSCDEKELRVINSSMLMIFDEMNSSGTGQIEILFISLLWMVLNVAASTIYENGFDGYGALMSGIFGNCLVEFVGRNNFLGNF